MSPSCRWWYVWKHWWRTSLWRVFFLDIAKCFSTINDDILLQKLKNYGIGGNAFYWLRYYLCGRRQCVRFNNIISELRPCPICVPLGLILGHILFLLYVIESHQYIWNQNCNIFADDAMIYSFGNHIRESDTNLQSALDSLSPWYTANKLSINQQIRCDVNRKKFSGPWCKYIHWYKWCSPKTS